MRFNPSVTEVARHFADYINRVAFRGERFTLMRGNKPVAELRPVPAGRRLGELPELLASLPRLSPEDAAALADDLDTARRQMAERPLRDPWAS
ncbi:MAG: type II toxin-antitoxin system Phd/YefM family antitoxin [Gemmatimonadetes bacterium]|jgi:antitoxin (DNA-binding transcriptional repressor) of toxin-antitoxin stability system|nr:type II toxin-antitoxin system Phd/YefM family antitoxin [Gemmatimonadota bacterium]